MNKISFWVEGLPIGQPRTKAARIGSFVRMYTPPVANQWKTEVGRSAMASMVRDNVKSITVPVRLACIFYFPRPKKHYLKGMLRTGCPYYHPQKPDLDNLEKAVMDALTNYGIWRDDAQVVCKYGESRWSGATVRCGASINIDWMGDEQFFPPLDFSIPF